MRKPGWVVSLSLSSGVVLAHAWGGLRLDDLGDAKPGGRGGGAQGGKWFVSQADGVVVCGDVPDVGSKAASG
jgi:hypothetical protein